MNSGSPIRILVVGCGNMGASHAKAYEQIPEFEICGLVSTGETKVVLNKALQSEYELFSDYYTALEATKPDAVCISTYPDTHEEYAIAAFKNNCHVFMEKPVATTVAGAQRVIDEAMRNKKKLVIGYILRHHPSWQKFIALGQDLGKPLVMRLNLNQQSHGRMWSVHKNIMGSLSPIVDCGVHYIDVMCQMTRALPVSVYAIGAKLTDEIPESNYNYGQLQIRFDDLSVGWYEAGWGPMISETAHFIKDVFGPGGSVSIVPKSIGAHRQSDDVASHTKTENICLHRSALNAADEFEYEDETINLADEPDHQELCNREQRYFLKSIQEDTDESLPLRDALNSLRIALACDESVRSGNVISLL